MRANIPAELKQAIVHCNKALFESYVVDRRLRPPIARTQLAVLGYLAEIPMPRMCLPMLCDGVEKLTAKRRQIEALRGCVNLPAAACIFDHMGDIVDLAPATALAKKLNTWPMTLTPPDYRVVINASTV